MPALKQDVRFCTAPDGTRIAVASVGSGPPLVRASHWLSHVEHDLASPVWRPWLTALSRHHTYHRYDQRGCGLSDRSFAGLSLDVWVSDLEAVVDHLGLERFPLIGMSQGGAVAISYAHRHPERVSRLVLVGAYAQGVLRREGAEQARLEAETMVNMMRVGWGSDNDAFRQVFTNQFIPGGTPEQLRWWTELQRRTASPEGAARTLEVFHDVDVVRLAASLDVPTLVMHARGDARVPFDEGRRLAALIPGARFVALESDNHVLLEGEPAWPQFLDELQGFLAEDTEPAPSSAASLTPAEAAVLELLAHGLSNQAIATQLGKTEKTVRNQLSVIFDKLGVKSRAEAIVHALRHP
ncbi:alpha/beta fold hydrolase [Piscinibacter gummiphilus]|uniref:Alpha/beta fold hydrolase n=1 Tax=Piscinibacter gummiphilus TaxID=946333 RepID=A0ABZ0CRG6_9BURK|nr:alpha/beta fold hydrolase [Piscinibacter gummiphilus]WOB07524.1 alpha/beta fold hydrolase [Piscinibacter gummiphilus]